MLKKLMLLLSCLFCFLTFAIAGRAEFDIDDITEFSVNIQDNDFLMYSYDLENNRLGASDFYIDNDIFGVLSTSSNMVGIFEIATGTVDCLTQLSMYDIKGVHLTGGDGIYCVLDNRNEICLFRNNILLSKIDLSSIVCSEAYEYFHYEDGFVYLIINCDDLENVLLYKFEVNNDKIAYCSKSKLSFRAISKKYGNKDQIENKLIGTGKDESVWYVSNRFIYGQDKTELIISITQTDAAGTTLKKLYQPVQMMNCMNQVKIYNGIPYLMNTLENKIEIINLNNVLELVSEEAAVIKCNVVRKNRGDVEQRIIPESISASVTRNSVMAKAETYRTFTWSCSAANLSCTNPAWIKPHYIGAAGGYASMPYCWGGFNTISTFEDGIRTGASIGNISTTQIGSTVGMDCSGFVSRMWSLSSHVWSGGLPNYCTALSSYAQLQKGDLLYKDGHVALVVGYSSAGSCVVYEETTSNSYDRVVKRTFSAATLAQYSPFAFNGY